MSSAYSHTHLYFERAKTYGDARQVMGFESIRANKYMEEKRRCNVCKKKLKEGYIMDKRSFCSLKCINEQLRIDEQEIKRIEEALADGLYFSK